MEKKKYAEPKVVSHEVVTFETLLSCHPPNIPAQTTDGNLPVCLRPDGTWFPR